MDLQAFRWLRKQGHAPAALLLPGTRVPAPLVRQKLEGGAVLAWLPLRAQTRGRAALAKLPRETLPLFPASDADVPRVADAWLRLHKEAPAGIEEAMLQVYDDPAHMRDYVAAEEALWARVYAAHPHKDDPGLMPDCLTEARFLLDAVLGAKGYADQEGFLTIEGFEAVARALLVKARKAELQNLVFHLQGVRTVSGW